MMGSERKFQINLKNVVCLFGNTFRGSEILPINGVFSPVTFRTYDNVELACFVHHFSRKVGNNYVAKSKFLDVANDGLFARVFFVPLYKYSFDDWVNMVALKTKKMQFTSFRKAFRSIVLALESLYEHHRYNFCLRSSIRIDEQNNAQILLDSKGTDSIEVGVREDIKAFNKLVADVIKKIKQTGDAGYTSFCLLNNHFLGRGDAFDESGSLSSYLYFVLHHPLFYEVEDEINCVYKLTMFRDMDESLFDNLMSQERISEIANWKTILQQNTFLHRIYSRKSGLYAASDTTSILKLYFNCYDHGQENGVKDVFEVHDELSALYPTAIYGLFYHFVTKIEFEKKFKGMSVLHYFREVHPSPNFLR